MAELTDKQVQVLPQAAASPMGVAVRPYLPGWEGVAWDHNAERLCKRGLLRPYVHGGFEITDEGRAARGVAAPAQAKPPTEFWTLLHEWADSMDEERRDAIEHRFCELFALVAAGVPPGPKTLANARPVATDGELAKARELASGVTLNARQLHQAWQLANPDPGDQDQEETEITIRWWQGGKDTDGDDAPEGYYAHLAEYAEEGALLLDPVRTIVGAPPSVVDRGPWVAQKWPDGRIVLQSDDFAHDVALIVNGDFADDTRRLRYAEGLAAQFNAGAQRLSHQRLPRPPKAEAETRTLAQIRCSPRPGGLPVLEGGRPWR